MRTANRGISRTIGRQSKSACATGISYRTLPCGATTSTCSGISARTPTMRSMFAPLTCKQPMTALSKGSGHGRSACSCWNANAAPPRRNSIIATSNPVFRAGLCRWRPLRARIGERAGVRRGGRRHAPLRVYQCLLRKPNSLIFSATVCGRRVETVEVALDTLKVVQSRGVHNSQTEHHDSIVNLVRRNMPQIEQRMTA